MKLPNILTISRIILTIGFIYFILQPGITCVLVAVILFILAALTDYYDGYFAKKYRLETDFGRIMDPIADKFLILAAFYLFVGMDLIGVWMFYIILIREVSVTATRLYAMKKGDVIAAEQSGKMKTVAQMIVIFTILFLLVVIESDFIFNLPVKIINGWLLFIDILMYLTVTLTIISGIDYFWTNRKTVIFGQFS